MSSIILDLNNLHGKASVEFMLKGVHINGYIEYENVNVGEFSYPNEISILKSSVYESIFEWKGMIINKDTKVVLQHITSHDRIPLQEYFAICSGVYLKMGRKYGPRWGIYSIFVEPLVFNHWNKNLTNEETINEIFNAQALMSAVC